MALDANIRGSVTGNGAEVDSNNNLLVNGPGYTTGGVPRGGTDTNSMSVSMFSEVDAGIKTGLRETVSAEVDKDYRLRVGLDNMLDQELFNYTTQNNSKHTVTFTTLVPTCTAAGINTNSTSLTTTGSGNTFGTFAQFPVGGTNTIVCEMSVAFSAQPNANQAIDFGMFQRGAATPFLPLDGVYFRVDSNGVSGVINTNGTEQTQLCNLALGAGAWVYTNNATNRYLIQMNNVSTTFWINNYKVAEIATPIGTNMPCKSQALPWSIRHGIVGAAGAAMQAIVSDYKIFIRGPVFADDLGTVGSRVFGSYQAPSGSGAIGQLVAGTVTTGTLVKPAAALPANASLTAGLPAALGGRALETVTLAVSTDAMFSSYQVPAASTTVPGRRLKITGIMLSAYISTVIAGGPWQTEYYLAFGHTAASLATADTASMATATTKAPRRIFLPGFTQTVTATQAVSTMVAQPATQIMFDQPIYVNPGEFVALVGNRSGTVGTSGVISHNFQLLYSWE